MPIIEGNESGSSVIDGIPVGLYYYFIGKNDYSNMTYLGYAPTIESVTYNPFLDVALMDLISNNFDVGRYGTPTGGIPKCFRIESNRKIEKQLYSGKVFKDKSSTIDNHEPKLECYPFRYFILTDYINPPLLIKPQYLPTGQLEVYVTTSPISQSGKYNLWVKQYKGDMDGNLEGMINNTSLMLPVASSTYSQFLATSSASFNQGVANSLLENDMSLRHGKQNNALSSINNLVGGGIGLGANLLTGNIGGTLTSGISTVLGKLGNDLALNQLTERSVFKENAISSMANAQISDMLSTPRSIKTTGNDTLFNLINSKQRIDLIEFEPNSYNKRRIKEYFNRYGYSINTYDYINFRSRKYYNFIKTHICNITSDTVPHADMQEIKDIFNSGLTFWHIDNGAVVENYEVENTEV